MKSSNIVSFPSLLVLVGVLVVGLIAGLIMWGPTGQSVEATNSEGYLRVSEMSWDFGEVPMSNGIATKEIVISNPSDVPVSLTDMQTSCMCTEVTLVRSSGEKGPTRGMAGHGPTRVSETLEPGESAKLVVEFDPNAHGPNGTGFIRRSVILQTTSVSQPTLQLDFQGNVVK